MTGTVDSACTVTPSLSMSLILASGLQQFSLTFRKNLPSLSIVATRGPVPPWEQEESLWSRYTQPP